MPFISVCLIFHIYIYVYIKNKKKRERQCEGQQNLSDGIVIKDIEEKVATTVESLNSRSIRKWKTAGILSSIKWERQKYDYLPLLWHRSGALALRCTICYRCFGLQVVPQF